MDTSVWVAGLTGAVAGLTAVTVGLYLLGGDRLGAAWAVLRGESAPKVEAPPPAPPARPLQFLAILQRDGRLLDFLLEDIAGATDAQIGQAVRVIHRDCRKSIDEHLELVPVLDGAEGDATTVPAGFDPAAIRLTGQVSGQPPFTGTLQHHGWRVKSTKLPTPPAGHDDSILAPAEVRIG